MKAATSGLLLLAAWDVRWPDNDALGGFMPLSVRLVSIHQFFAQASIVPTEDYKTKQILFCVVSGLGCRKLRAGTREIPGFRRGAIAKSLQSDRPLVS
jgi:hypothetical protein